MDSKWQPIKTAPKDGTWIVGAWVNDEDDFAYLMSVVRYNGNGNWREKVGIDCEEPVGMPTHWMPLPEPPTKGETDFGF